MPAFFSKHNILCRKFFITIAEQEQSSFPGCPYAARSRNNGLPTVFSGKYTPSEPPHRPDRWTDNCS